MNDDDKGKRSETFVVVTAALCDGTCSKEPSSKSHAGPVKVTTEEYRQGWTRIFGTPVEVGEA